MNNQLYFSEIKRYSLSMRTRLKLNEKSNNIQSTKTELTCFKIIEIKVQQIQLERMTNYSRLYLIYFVLKFEKSLKSFRNISHCGNEQNVGFIVFVSKTRYFSTKFIQKLEKWQISIVWMGLTMQTSMASYSKTLAYLCFPTTDIKVVCYHAQK